MSISNCAFLNFFLFISFILNMINELYSKNFYSITEIIQTIWKPRFPLWELFKKKKKNRLILADHLHCVTYSWS